MNKDDSKFKRKEQVKNNTKEYRKRIKLGIFSLPSADVDKNINTDPVPLFEQLNDHIIDQNNKSTPEHDRPDDQANNQCNFQSDTEQDDNFWFQEHSNNSFLDDLEEKEYQRNNLLFFSSLKN